MRKYRAAIIGCGRIASTFSKDPLRKGVITHAAAYQKHPQTELIAACDLDCNKLREFGEYWKVGALYDNVAKLLEKEEIDILSICTPPATHFEVLKIAAQYPLKAIFCEKPLADKVTNANKMLALCRKNRIILQVGHQRRFDPLHQGIKKIILSGNLGSVQQVNFFYTAGVNNTGSHMFDLLRFFFGDVEWIEGYYSKNLSRRQGDHNIDGLIKFRNGLLATFQSLDVDQYMVFELDCFMEKGKFVLKNSGFNVDMYKVTQSKFYSGYKELKFVKSGLNESYRRDFLYYAVDHLVRCIHKGLESVSSGLDGLKALELIEASISSAEADGKRIMF